MSTDISLKQVMPDLAALEEPTMREANKRRGDGHGVYLTHRRALAKRLKWRGVIQRENFRSPNRGMTIPGREKGLADRTSHRSPYVPDLRKRLEIAPGLANDLTK